MLEIFLIWKLAQHIGKTATDKGLKKFRYQLMSVLLWIFSEITGVIIGIALSGNYERKWPVYLLGIICGIIGAGISVLIMRLIPGEDSNSTAAISDDILEVTRQSGFGRSVWIPIIAIILVSSCCLLSFGGVAISQISGQVRAANPTIGIKLDKSGNILQYDSEIPSDTEIIYFGFDLYNPSAQNLLITCYWYIDGEVAYLSFIGTSGSGRVVTLLDQEHLEVSMFDKAVYKVIAFMGDIELTAASFTVK